MNAARYFFAAVVALHGLIHLLGTVSYLKLARVQGLPYKTTVLGGRLDLGDLGIGVFGALWGMAALGFLVSVVGIVLQSSWWVSTLMAISLFSLALTMLDSSVALTGVVVNAVILALLWFAPRFSSP